VSVYRVSAVVTRSIRLGEADRIVTLVSKEKGKIRAVVKGVRKTTSKWGGRLEPMAHLNLMCWQGRELDTITQAEVVESHRRLREDLDLLGWASVILEAADQVSQERVPAPRIYRMLVGALRALEETRSPLTPGAFLWKLLLAEGWGMVAEQCVSCGCRDGLVALDFERGGTVCGRCRMGGEPLDGEALLLLQEILGGRLAKALSRPWSPAVERLNWLAQRALEAHLERRLKSAAQLACG
jgi:DNA repair protein RecO (recombination protein O)